MNDTANVRVEVVLSVVTNRLLCSIFDIERFLSWLEKRDVWAYEVASVSKKYTAYILNQHPQLKNISQKRLDRVHDQKSAVEFQLWAMATFGDFLTIRRGRQ